MDDRQYRDEALLNHVRTLLDVSQDFSKEEILGMYLENKIDVSYITDDVKVRFDRIYH